MYDSTKSIREDAFGTDASQYPADEFELAAV